MMERSSKFMSISGLSCALAGVYALAGAFIAYKFVGFNPDVIIDSTIKAGHISPAFLRVILLAIVILVLTIGTGVFLSHRMANKTGEALWNPSTKRLLINILVPLLVGGILIFILILKGFIGLVAPLTLLFYGLALYNVSKFTFEELKSLGLIEIALGLTSSYFVEYGLLLWALGFGLVHIVYGIYLHYRYEK